MEQIRGRKAKCNARPIVKGDENEAPSVAFGNGSEEVLEREPRAEAIEKHIAVDTEKFVGKDFLNCFEQRNDRAVSVAPFADQMSMRVIPAIEGKSRVVNIRQSPGRRVRAPSRKRGIDVPARAEVHSGRR
jgi:hypothetical protein